MGTGMRPAPRTLGPAVASSLGLLALAAALTGPLLPCLGSCYVDYEALHGLALGKIEGADARLNSWILAWVQHALATEPGELFRANIFYPARNALAQSEHMLGIAVPALPLQLFPANPVALHQLVAVLSFPILGLTSAALARWLTGSHWAGFLAGALAMAMPWRLSELAHVQLLSAQWFPLVWLLMARIATGEARRRDPWLLAAALALQLLSSFYLAYFLAFSCALLLATLRLRGRLAPGALPLLAAATALPAALLLLTALPYLEARAGGGLVHSVEIFDSLAPAKAWSYLAPRLTLLDGSLPRGISYELPLAACALALLSLLPARGARPAQPQPRSLVPALWAVAVGAFVMVLGRELSLGDRVLSLPGHWASQLVPGFSNLRNPLRWALVIGLVVPILAALGAWRLERRSLAPSHGARFALRAALALALVATTPWPALPVAEAWPERERVAPVYRALSRLPAAPVVEIPWSLQPEHDVQLASRYMLGSTLHWRPIANGTSGYAPPGYAWLRQMAHPLPQRDALERLQRLTDVRWAVVHVDRLSPLALERWRAAAAAGLVRPVYADAHAQIHELPRGAETGRWLPQLVSEEPRPRTLAGLPRAPLSLPDPAGSLRAELPERFQLLGYRRLPQLVPLLLENRSALPWPGLDPSDEGLVRLRFHFASEDGEPVWTDSVALPVDLPAGSRVSTGAPVWPPTEPGRYRLRLDLVQRIGGADRRLPVPAVEGVVDVTRTQRVTGG